MESFKSFYTEEEAVDLLKLLTDNGIPGKLEKIKLISDKIIIGDGLEPTISVMIAPTDFTRAHQLINEQVHKNIANVEQDYYLYSFSDEELMDIISKSDEWSEQDFVIAQKILSDRGHPISDQEISKITSARINELAVPEKEQPIWIIFGYIFSIFLCIWGFFFGLLLLTAKKLLPDGNKVFLYTKRTRDHGFAIVIISALMIIFAIVERISFWVFGWF